MSPSIGSPSCAGSGSSSGCLSSWKDLRRASFVVPMPRGLSGALLNVLLLLPSTSFPWAVLYGRLPDLLHCPPVRNAWDRFCCRCFSARLLLCSVCRPWWRSHTEGRTVFPTTSPRPPLFALPSPSPTVPHVGDVINMATPIESPSLPL